MLVTTGHPIIPDQIDEHGIPVVRVPTLKEMLDLGGQEPVKYPFTKTYEEAEMDPFVLLTTSGTTSVPKLVIIRHGWVSAVERAHSVPDSNGLPPSFSIFKNKKLWSPLPAFHVSTSSITSSGTRHRGVKFRFAKSFLNRAED